MYPTSGNMTCALKVETQTPGWHKTLTKVLKIIDGVSYSIDAERGIARVSGRIDPGKLLSMLRKASKHAELLWVDSGNHGGYYIENQYSYGSMENQYYMIDPYQSGYSHSQYYPCQPYDPYYSYYEPPSRYFSHAPPPPQNPRLTSLCNMM